MSLGLVAYGSSDESDDDNSNTNDSTSIKSTVNNETKQLYMNEDDDILLKDNTLSSLPAPKIRLHELDIDVKKLKSSGTVKISIPSLSQLDDEESTEPPCKKKLKPSQKGSGLFALLPTPKHQGLVPQAVSNKIASSTSKPKPTLKPSTSIPRIPAPSKPATYNKPSLTDYDDSGDEDDNRDKIKMDFFSLEKQEENLPVVSYPDVCVEKQETTLDNSDDNQALSFSNNIQPTSWSRISANEGKISVDESTPSYPNTQDFMSVATDDLELNEEALQHLCGRRDRNRIQGGSMQLIDVSGDAIMPDSREWLTKQLTEEKNTIVQSHKKKDGPTSQQRRKHQITYLAFQAKEHELELKNQWANNRMSRKQTQAKYGF